MKKIKAFFIAAAFFAASFGFSEKSKVKLLKLDNGIPVYFRNNNTSQIDSFSIVVKGGIAYYSKEDSGIENVLFDLICEGSEKYPYKYLTQLAFNTESSISSGTSVDGSVLKCVSINNYFPHMIEIAADILKNPSLDEKSYNKIMTTNMQNIQSYMNDPASLVIYYAEQMIYDGHPYGTNSSVTQDSFENITLDKIKEFHKSILDSRRISLVVYTSNDEKFIMEKLNHEFSDIPAGTCELKSLQVPLISVKPVNAVFLNPNAASTGYAGRFFASVPVTDPDYPKARIAALIYDDILFNVVREKHGACYTPSNYLDSSAAPYACEYIYRISDLENFTKYVSEARAIMEEGKVIAGEDENGNYIFQDLGERLQGFINSYINKKYSSQNTSSGINGRMVSSLLQFNDIYKADELTMIARTTTVEDVLRIFKKYWIDEPSSWVVVTGPEDEDKVHF